jgi:hypothetical protein
MAEPEDNQSEWDEYQWERFLQERDRETDRFMELLEKYMDDPDCDRIIAREMGWTHLESALDAEEDLDDEEDEVLDEDEEELEEETPEPCVMDGEEPGEPYRKHPLHRSAFALTMWVLDFFEQHPDLQDHTAAVDLASHCATVSAKLAAALGGDEEREIGLTIAYLKRALKAANDALMCSNQLSEEGRLGKRSARSLLRRVFEVRGGIVQLMGEYRAEWRRRWDS